MATDFPEDPAASVLKCKVLRDSQKTWLFTSILLYSFSFSLHPLYITCFILHLALFIPFFYGWHICFGYIYTFYCKSLPFSHVASSKHFLSSRTCRLSIYVLCISGPAPVFHPYSGVRLQSHYIPHYTFIITLTLETSLSSEMLLTLYTTRCHMRDESSLEK